MVDFHSKDLKFIKSDTVSLQRYLDKSRLSHDLTLRGFFGEGGEVLALEAPAASRSAYRRLYSAGDSPVVPFFHIPLRAALNYG